MQSLILDKGLYKTGPVDVPLISRLFPTLCFYTRALLVVNRANIKAKAGLYDDAAWVNNSMFMLKTLEKVGVEFEIAGLENVLGLKGPCVFVANHMSTLETFVMPCLIAPYKKVTFVVKRALVEMPFFRYIMRSRNPIVVGRENPREDLKAVIDGGAEKIKQGYSIVVFPQTTRMLEFEPDKFNSIGIKLAIKAGVPVVPVALRTDAWVPGNIFKDLGRIDPSKKVSFRFGQPITVTGRGTKEHAETIEFISQNLSSWGMKIMDKTASR